VQVKRLITKRIRRSAPGIDVVADVNADVSVNVNARRSTRIPPPQPPRDKNAGTDERGKEIP
jgi:hypothetical protein